MLVVQYESVICSIHSYIQLNYRSVLVFEQSISALIDKYTCAHFYNYFLTIIAVNHVQYAHKNVQTVFGIRILVYDSCALQLQAMSE